MYVSVELGKLVIVVSLRVHESERNLTFRAYRTRRHPTFGFIVPLPRRRAWPSTECSVRSWRRRVRGLCVECGHDLLGSTERCSVYKSPTRRSKRAISPPNDGVPILHPCTMILECGIATDRADSFPQDRPIFSLWHAVGSVARRGRGRDDHKPLSNGRLRGRVASCVDGQRGEGSGRGMDGSRLIHMVRGLLLAGNAVASDDDRGHCFINGTRHAYVTPPFRRNSVLQHTIHVVKLGP